MGTPPTSADSPAHVITALLSRLARRIRLQRVHSLQEELAWGPVAASLAITLVGFVAASLWLSYDGITERKRLILAFSESAKNHLETRQRQVVARLHDMRGSISTTRFDPVEHEDRIELPFSASGSLDRELFSAVLLVDGEGHVLQSLVGEIRQEALTGAATRLHYTDVLGASAADLQRPLAEGRPAALPVQRFDQLNALLGRGVLADQVPPGGKMDLSKVYDFVVALPLSTESPRAPAEHAPMAIVAAVSWYPFQALLDEIANQSVALGLRSGYAYLTQSDGDTIIGHKLRDQAGGVNSLYGDSISNKHQLPDLTAQLLHHPGTVYYYRFRNYKYAALQQINQPDFLHGDALEWRLGVGVDVWPDMTMAPLRASLLVFAVGVLVTGGVYATTRAIAKRASMSVSRLTELVKRAEQNEFMLVDAGGNHDELSELHEAISRLIVRLRGDLTFTPLRNPYIVGNPIQDPAMFFGRQADVAWLESHLRTPGNELILLAGQRRIGKTSLLHLIRRVGVTWDVCPFFFDTQELLHVAQDDASFYDALTSRMLEQLPSVCPGLAAPDLGRHAGQATAITKCLKYVHASCRRPPVLLFDELETLQQKLSATGLSPAVFAFLASLVDSTQVSASIVISGSEVSDRHPSGPFGHLLAKAIRRRIGLLGLDEARAIVLEPIKGQVQTEATAVSRILRFTGGHPYYTQDACHRLVHVLNSRRERNVGEAVVSEVVHRVLDNPPPQLDHAWHQLPERARLLAIALASALAEPEAYVDLMNACNELALEVREPLLKARHELNKARDLLIHRDWIERDETAGYRFRIDMYRLWLQREHPSRMLVALG